MGDYTGYIVVTYTVSGVVLSLLALISYRRMKFSEREAASHRRRRKGQD